MFTNPNIQSNITQFNRNSFSFLFGFGMYSSLNNTYYYIMDFYDNKVYILNDDWSFNSFKTFNQPSYMISIGNSLYMTGYRNVWKVDQDLNILINYNPSGISNPYLSWYRGISKNPSNRLIYVVAANLNEIQIFNFDLNLIRRLSTEPHQPWSITESLNKLYVGTRKGIILVFQNEEIIYQFNGCNGNNDILTSIYFDPTDYIATSCQNPNKLYLFSPNGSFTGKSLTTPIFPRYIGFDSKGRFILISRDQISIYS